MIHVAVAQTCDVCFSGEDISLHEEKLHLQIGGAHFHIKVLYRETACLHGEEVVALTGHVEIFHESNHVCPSPVNLKARVSATIKIFRHDETHRKFKMM